MKRTSPSNTATISWRGFLCIFPILGMIALWNLWGLTQPSSFGSDYIWYRDGATRLLSGQPLYDPAMLRGPFEYLVPSLFGKFNQAPWIIPIAVPFSALPQSVAEAAWLLLVDAALVGALALAWPRSLNVRLQAYVGVLIVTTPALIIGLEWGNLQGLCVLGIALFWRGYIRESRSLMIVGLTLAALKVVPAIALVGVLPLLGRKAIPVVLAAIGAIGILSLPVLIVNGPGAFIDFVRVSADIRPVVSANVAPALALGVAIPIDSAFVLTRITGVILLVLIALTVREPRVRLFLLLLVSSLLVTNLYSDWLLDPIVGGLIVLADPHWRSRVERLLGAQDGTEQHSQIRGDQGRISP